MAFDACMMRAVLDEFSSEFPEAKIEKVLQPQNDEIDMLIHYGRQSKRLVFNVGPNAPRLQLSKTAKENPLKAPMFCMLLRKYFTGAKIVSVSQLGFDRIAVFNVSCYDEMGFAVRKKIICEIMGKYANLVITDEDDRILAAMKVIDFAASTVRQVLPGMKYQIPQIQDKLLPLTVDREAFFEKLSEFQSERTAEKFITSTYSGIATQIAHELVYRASGRCDVPVSEMDKEKFYQVFYEWQMLLTDGRYMPTVALDDTGKPIDYSYMDITYLGDKVRVCHFEKLSDLFDMYFAEKDRLEKIHQRGRDLVVLIGNAIARTERKLAVQRQALLDSERGEEYRRCGDLITANIYRLKRGMTEFTTVDYYDESCPTVKITLDPRISPSDNAQRNYKLYNKAKVAKTVLTEQIEIWERELVYLDSVKTFLENAKTEDDIAEIRDELYSSGYAAKLKGYNPPKKIRSEHLTLTTSGGYKLLVGRNNVQNDRLTFKVATKDCIWFHSKDVPGSHVILVTDGEEPSDNDYTEAASVAAYYSKARQADRVAVDYTRVKNIKKPQGAKPGFVTYKTYYTAYVKPMSKEELSGNG